MYKILKKWNGHPEATTIGKIYWVNESNDFKDNKNTDRNAKYGVWEEDLSTVNLGYGVGYDYLVGRNEVEEYNKQFDKPLPESVEGTVKFYSGPMPKTSDETPKGDLLMGSVHVDTLKRAYGPLSDDPLVNPKKAAGSVKAPMHTLPTLALIQIANVMAGGAHKYGYYNFRESQVDAQTYIGAMQRHFLKWQDGIDFDKESGQHELAHLAACCMIMIDAHYTGKFIDNRSKTGLVEKMLKDSEAEFNDFVVKHPKKDNK